MSGIQNLSHLPLRIALAAIIGGGAASTASAAPPLPRPPGPPPVPSVEELATISSLNTAQQNELRAALIARRDALDANDKRARDVLDTQRDKDRAEHERIDAQTSERIRKALGEDGFRNYANWLATHGPGPGSRMWRDDMRPPRGGPLAPGPEGLRGPGPRPDAPPPDAPPPPNGAAPNAPAVTN